MSNKTGWGSELFHTYHRLDKQYSSYPAFEHFQQQISAFERLSALRDSRKQRKPLALSVNIPFCANACYYCTAKNIVTKDRSRATEYLRCLEQEIRLIAQHISTDRPIEQLHFGGGTPTFLNPAQLQQLMNCLKENFNIISNNFTQYSIDIDPRETDWPAMGVLRDIGFNRVNIEVQGLDPSVQRAINRLQSIEQTQNIVEAARTLQFRSVNISLMYGLPKQTPQSFAQMLAEVLKLTPDRVALQSFKHQPIKYPVQKRINAEDLPCPVDIEQILRDAQQQLSQAGYYYIGMGHFALEDDDFTYAQEDGLLQHGTQGYTTCLNSDIVGFGISAVSHVGKLYYHNSHDLTAYQNACSKNQLPPAQGLFCSNDDQIRRSIIQSLTCQFCVDFKRIEQDYAINSKEYFCKQWPQLEQMHNDGLLILNEHSLTMVEHGRFFTLAVCQLFDRYFAQEGVIKMPVSKAL